MLRLAAAQLTVSKTSKIALPQLRVNTRGIHDVAEYFHYTRAIVGSVPDSFARHSLRFHEPKEPIYLDKAREQHRNYVEQLRSKQLKVKQIEPDDRYPDLVFVEDPAVVLEGVALLTHMSPRSRSGEVGPIRGVLEEMGLRVVSMQQPEAFLDGGDVLFTGREFLVGLSSRTNKAGIEEFAKVFNQWKVTGIPVGDGVLHLKSMSSMCGLDTIAIGDSQAGRQAWRDIEAKAQYKYKRVAFPDNNGANCLYINGTIFHPAESDYPESYKVWQTLDCPKVSLSNTEMAKADGSLTCSSIRIN